MLRRSPMKYDRINGSWVVLVRVILTERENGSIFKKMPAMRECHFILMEQGGYTKTNLCQTGLKGWEFDEKRVKASTWWHGPLCLFCLERLRWRTKIMMVRWKVKCFQNLWRNIFQKCFIVKVCSWLVISARWRAISKQ